MIAQNFLTADVVHKLSQPESAKPLVLYFYRHFSLPMENPIPNVTSSFTTTHAIT